MPKKKKVLTETLYTYIKPVNRKFVEVFTKRHKISYSLFVDRLIERARKNKSKDQEKIA